jgi:hypothetical protein
MAAETAPASQGLASRSQRTGDEEIFLHKTEPAALGRAVVRIKNAGQRFGVERFDDRGDEIAAAEPLEVERVRGGGAPQAKRVDRLAAVADHRPIIGHADQRRWVVRNHVQHSGAHFERAGERHLDALARPYDFPRIGIAQPVVRALLLPAVANFLPEDAVLVAKPIAHRWQRHRRHRVQEAGREAAEAAVAQACIGFLVKNLHPLAAVLVEAPLDHGIEHEVHDVVAERAANEKLNRDIIDPLRILARVGLLRTQPAVRKNVSHRAGGGFVALPRVGGRRFDDIVELQMPLVERVRNSGEGRRADAVLAQEDVRIG